ncbi:MAG: hypothetical protein ABFD52_05495 [Acidobacteriota bacterium]
MRRILLTLLLFVGICGQFVFGTAQQGDILTHEGKKYKIQTNPLERYLEQHPDSRPRSRIHSTGLWRGYVASWEFKNKKLVITDIRILASMEGPEENRWRSVLSEIFPGQREVFAEWFSGHIIVPTGKLVKRVMMGYASEYSSYWILWVSKGEIIKEWRGSRRAFNKFRKAQFELFKKTETYRAAWVKTRNDPESANLTDREIEEFLFGIYSEEIMSMMGEIIR